MRKLIIMTFSLFTSVLSFGQVPDSTKKVDTVYLKINEINNHWLYDEIKSQGVVFPDIVFGQALLESGNFKSNVFKENNNLFGMRLPKVRKTTAIGKNRGYAKYENWVQSVGDYLLWQQSIPKKYLKSRENYFYYLQKYYCTSPHYQSRVKRTIKEHKQHLN